MYRYMISFNYKMPNGIGLTTFELPCKRPIRSMDDITRIVTKLRNEGYTDAVVLSFSLFADPAPNPQAAS
ncbi:hypothetical protein ACIBP4_02595 [Micromonospora maritima]|uniref:Uncharacterized protein n=1 Tax=Micromonospora maritima TaxID=986711 RepID=A0ABW7ZEB9_9ACTN